MSRHDTYDERRERLRAIYDEMRADLGHSDSAVEAIATLTGRSEWTVWMWVSDNARASTIPADTLELLEMKRRAMT